jgi:hypothetical protein
MRGAKKSNTHTRGLEVGQPSKVCVFPFNFLFNVFCFFFCFFRHQYFKSVSFFVFYLALYLEKYTNLYYIKRLDVMVAWYVLTSPPCTPFK